MSGIVGIVNLKGASVERDLLQSLAESMAFRGPDAQEIWSQGAVGLGHAMLRTTREASHEHQPASLDGHTWITADARIDARAELSQELSSKGRKNLKLATDAELILHSYQVWGEACVQHLLGDFAFAIWDANRRLLFCARDHFGIKLLYYARVGDCLVFSNTLNTVRLHAEVSDKLNDRAIGDFLLCGFNYDESTTTLADIQRLPPAHTLILSGKNLRRTRYWTLPVEAPLRYRRASDYVEHFRELLQHAVADRLRTDRVGVFLSGGLDSTAVAATAQSLLARDSAPGELRAFTTVLDQLLPDQEGYYSGLVAKHLRFPIEYLVCDNYRLFERCDQPELYYPEPYQCALGAMEYDSYQQAGSYSRVALTGEGGDPGLIPSLAYFKGRRFASLIGGSALYFASHRRLPRLGFRVSFQRWLGRRRADPYPRWLNASFQSRLELKARWNEIRSEPRSEHPLHPAAYGAVTAPYWSFVFSGYDASVSSTAVEIRHPLFDVRLMRYFLALPALPWRADKELLRVTMRGALPEEVLHRPKAPLPGDPAAILAQRKPGLMDQFDPVPHLANYIDISRLRADDAGQDPETLHLDMRAVALNFWLRYSWPFRYSYAGAGRGYDRARTAPRKKAV